MVGLKGKAVNNPEFHQEVKLQVLSQQLLTRTFKQRKDKPVIHKSG